MDTTVYVVIDVHNIFLLKNVLRGLCLQSSTPYEALVGNVSENGI
jgi:hypothetical protein